MLQVQSRLAISPLPLATTSFLNPPFTLLSLNSQNVSLTLYLALLHSHSTLPCVSLSTCDPLCLLCSRFSSSHNFLLAHSNIYPHSFATLRSHPPPLHLSPLLPQSTLYLAFPRFTKRPLTLYLAFPPVILSACSSLTLYLAIPPLILSACYGLRGRGGDENAGAAAEVLGQPTCG